MLDCKDMFGLLDYDDSKVDTKSTVNSEQHMRMFIEAIYRTKSLEETDYRYCVKNDSSLPEEGMQPRRLKQSPF